MATNVSQQDETLHKVIEWCEQREVEGLRLANALLQKHDLAAYAVVKAQIDALSQDRRTLPFHARGYSGSMPSCLNYEDIDDSSPDLQPQVGDYGVAVLENAHGQEEIPFHVEREEHTGLPVALLNTRLYAKPEDDIDDGQYVSLFQLYLDGFMLSRTGRKRNKDAEA